MKWTEQTYRQGGLAATTHWTAILTIVIKSPRTAAVLRRNPLGLYVKAISWSREFVPGARQ